MMKFKTADANLVFFEKKVVHLLQLLHSREEKAHRHLKSYLESLKGNLKCAFQKHL